MIGKANGWRACWPPEFLFLYRAGAGRVQRGRGCQHLARAVASRAAIHRDTPAAGIIGSFLERPNEFAEVRNLAIDQQPAANCVAPRSEMLAFTFLT